MRGLMPSFSFHHAAHRLAVALIVGSILYGLLGNYGQGYLLFWPPAVFNYWYVWQPFTTLFIANGPMPIIFGALIIYSIGSQIEYRWGKSKLIKICIGIPVAANGVVLFLYLIVPSAMMQGPYFGGHAVVSTMWITYGLMAELSGQMLNFWGTPIKGSTFALIGLGFVVLGGLFSSWGLVLPELISAAMVYLYMYRRRLPFNFDAIFRRYDEWKLKRLKAKRGIKIVVSNKNDDKSDDKYIH